jgi:hypothetical protein
MSVDYSKFDKVVDSDDEKPKTHVAESCGNCGNRPSAPLRCGQCKVRVYCSAECQRTDWQFHKRLCVKPKTETAKEPAKKPEPPKPRSTAPTKAADSDTEEKLDWYRHREWKAPMKLDAKPVKLDESSESAPLSSAPSSRGGSAWNAAETWEEKDMTSWAKEWLKAQEGVSKVEGDASIPFVRGTKRYLFDFSFTLDFQGTEYHVHDFSDSEPQPVLKGKDNVATLKEALKSLRESFLAAYRIN